MKLSLLETRELIDRYNSELRKLEFQLEKTQGTIDELKSSLSDFEGGSTAKRRGRPAKVRVKAGKKAVKKTATRKRKASAVKKTGDSAGKRGRPPVVTAWDELIMGALGGASEPTKSKVFLDLAKKNKSVSRGMSEAGMRAKINASLQKLVNKTGQVKKVPAEGRGYAYQLA